MTLDAVTWNNGSSTTGTLTSSAAASEGTLASGSKLLCPTCTQYLQTYGKSRPIPFRINFLKKIHTRFKRELREVRFQGWQDAQVLEIEDRMSEREFQLVFNGVDESDTSRLPSQQSSVSGSPAPSTLTLTTVQVAEVITISEEAAGTGPAGERLDKDKENASSTLCTTTTTPSIPKDSEALVIKIEDDDVTLLTRSKPENVEVRTYHSEASVGELFGNGWRVEPVMGYTLVNFGGSDRTRMVPMNPTVPSLTVTFNRSAETITFAFRVLVNGLCLLSSGGGPPALHMPEMADDDESEEEEEVAVPDNNKDGPSPSPKGAIGTTHP
ncbi:hypothetical protein BGZ65_003047 [Modicella reniformis]|uniref:Uncharacterized protein n=1 Tax=Modicella reniformis TaxID=1440133 RepID=A0A9P6MHX6_9FUNG|nr:hypothetical protein BGZ65_003047 [Modicella reniformis]